MTFTKTSQKFGQWADSRANTVYGLGFASEQHLTQVGLQGYMVGGAGLGEAQHNYDTIPVFSHASSLIILRCGYCGVTNKASKEDSVML